MEREAGSGAEAPDDYLVTALQVFECCGVDPSGALPVTAVMEKFAPFVSTDKSEYSYLHSLLDPESMNSEINAKELARALEKYSERQNFKFDLNNSFNLKNNHTSLDSDSGVLIDEFQILEDLQLELHKKGQLVMKLRRQLDTTNLLHDETIVTVTSERDSLRAALQLMREENHSLVSIRQEYEDCCEKLYSTETLLENTEKQLDVTRRKERHLQHTVDKLETDRATLQALLSKSKEECHKNNEMFTNRHAALFEENENLKMSYADLSTRFQYQEEQLQQILKEKVLLEIEVKDMLNKSNHRDSKLDKSVDISYTEAQLLSALDTLNSKMEYQDENIPEDQFYVSDEQVECDLPSLFDELQSLNIFKKNTEECETCQMRDDASYDTTGMQTDHCRCDQNNNVDYTNFEKNVIHANCPKCIAKNCRISELEIETKSNRSEKIMKDMQVELVNYEHNLTVLQTNFECVEDKNKRFQNIIEGLRNKLDCLDALLLKIDTCAVGTQTLCDDTTSVSTQTNESCAECDKRTLEPPCGATVNTTRSFMWDIFRGTFQLFAVICFATAILFLYNVSHYNYSTRHCVRHSGIVPWEWMSVHDLLNFLFRIEYVGEIPM